MQRGHTVYTQQGHDCSRISSQKINVLVLFVALYVLHQGRRSFGRKQLRSKEFFYPARGASCVALLRPQMSESEFGVLKSASQVEELATSRTWDPSKMG